MQLEIAIANTNPPEDRPDVLCQFRHANQAAPDEFIDAMVDMVSEWLSWFSENIFLDTAAPESILCEFSTYRQ